MSGLESLNPEQRAAVLHEGGPLVVFAGAGSGKTRVITHRVAHLVAERGVRPYRVLAVTFTNKAAGEMRERLSGLLGDRADDLWVGTFHSTCARLLRRYAEAVGIRRDFTIYDDSDQQAMIKRVLSDMALDDRRWAPKKVAGRINRAKHWVEGPDQMSADDSFDEQVQKIYRVYEEHMARAGALDFGDLIYRLVVAIEAEPRLAEELSQRFSHVLVDEFQDTNHVQYRLVKNLAARHRQVCVVGDDDQSIYRWRGADRRNILDFRTEFPDATVIKLEQNYRSTKRIVRVAHAVIRRNEDREPKALWTDNREGSEVLVVRCQDERDEARMLVRAVRELLREARVLSDMAIFYRVHAQSRVIEEALRAANLPYRVVGGMRFYDRAEIKDFLAYLRVLHNLDDDVSLLRVINRPARGVGKTTVERVLEAAARAGTGVWAVLSEPAAAGLGNAAQKKLRGFTALIEELRKGALDGMALAALGEAVLTRSGYLEMLDQEDSAESDARRDNLREMLGSLEEFQAEAEDPTLASFLELVTLQTSADEALDGDRLTLMTVHAAKGLEFPVVMVTGLEEQTFPMRGGGLYEDPDELEEERRLAYVAFTRAKERLLLSYADVRRLFGQVRPTEPSRFLAEIPPEDTHWLGAPAPRHEPERASPGAGHHRDDSYVDLSEGSDLYDEGLRLGMRVRHAKFGVGCVRQVDDGIPPKVAVDFPGWGLKRIVATYLEPA